MTLFQKLTEVRIQQRNKHDLGSTYVEDSINSLTNYEFLEELSCALETLLQEKEQKK